MTHQTGTRTHYSIIGVDVYATREHIEQECFRQCEQHTKKGDFDSKIALRLLESAYEVLMDSSLRIAYDRSIGITDLAGDRYTVSGKTRYDELLNQRKWKANSIVAGVIAFIGLWIAAAITTDRPSRVQVLPHGEIVLRLPEDLRYRQLMCEDLENPPLNLACETLEADVERATIRILKQQ